ncbi:salicylate 1-monooxygenase [Acinetobacter pittii]|uniref:salicylate 1-monooxygenase n=1 Tax=Acinetobacter pittii TaxID=48296 RepID=UPI002380C084|nr:salicylate 1-monooxygenase [Acinetobacter pittii]MDE4038313.1 salicylate 1-monooxygenase [Acinetobacter pittii]WPP88978.1 salicylate 1-monooxygenase [Acinetobacter pittii]
MNTHIRIAVVGGGIAGLALASNLSKHAHLDVQMFESAPQFSEIGAGISFGANAVKAIEMLGLANEYQAIADKVSAPFQDVWFQWRNGYTDEYLSASIATDVGQSSVHRSDFLDAIIPHMPTQNVHFSKRLEAIEEQNDQVILHFNDGSQYECDYLIGADGIRSVARQYVLATHDLPPVHPRFSGTWAYRGIISHASFKEALQQINSDTDLADIPQMLLGKDKHILTFPIRKGEQINIVAFCSNREDTVLPVDTPWTKPVDKAQMLSDFSDWSESCQTLLGLIEQPTIWALHEIEELSTYQSASGHVIVMGDAAHAMLPHQGAGAGQGLEDALILAALLSTKNLHADQLTDVSLIYEKLRLKRACRVQQTSRESGEIYECYSTQYPTFAEIGEHLEHRFDWLWQHDLEQDVAEAKQQLHQLKIATI